MRKHVRVDDWSGWRHQARPHVNRRLPLEPAVLPIKDTPAFADRDTYPRIVPQFGDALPKMLAQWQALQIIESQFVLGGDPLGQLLGIELFHPAIRVRDFCSEVIIHDVAFSGRRVQQSLRLRGTRHDKDDGEHSDCDWTVSSHLILLRSQPEKEL